MKKVFALLTVLIIALISVAVADTIDVSALTMDELVELEARIETSLLGSILTNNTELPLGRYVAGEDIAAGRYVVTASSTYSSPEIYVKVYDANNNLVESYTLSPDISCKVTLKDGMAMEIDNNHGYEIHAKIRTMAGFMIQSSGYTLTTTTMANGTNIATPVSVVGSESSEYIFLLDKWNQYKATMLGSGMIKIENWYRFNAADGNPFNLNHSVCVINTTDGSSDFTWLDDAHTAFTVTLTDSQVSQLNNPTVVAFAGDKTGKPVYTYLYDKWNQYKAFLLSDDVICIDNWYRFNASEGNPFSFNHSVTVIQISNNDCSFTWLDDTHTSFTVMLQDSEQSGLSTPTLVSFTLGE